MFFKPLVWKPSSKTASIDKNAKITCEFDSFLTDFAKDLRADEGIDLVEIKKGFPDSIKSKAGNAFKESDEAYAIEIDNNKVSVYSDTKRGALYALSTIKSMTQDGELCEMFLYDAPASPIRGYRVFTPGMDNMQHFKDAVDLMVKYKYNSLMLEIGGAMEYKRHPEINAHWVEYCRELTKVSDRTHDIQHRTYPWRKNSIHVDNGFGTVMTQEEMREIIKYCEDRCIDIVPEVPSMSHCDYIVGTYPEINERAEDKHPDTYCPSNPKSYEILFDILEEVIEVFKPKYINIGHDELYSIALCDKCRGKDPVDLYVGDITKINDFLKARGVHTIMWCDKLYDVEEITDEPWGGVQYKTPDHPAYVPQMTGCLGKIPKDVIMLDWYWKYADVEQRGKATDSGYKMLYGNFNAMGMEQYRDNMDLGIMGAYVSNWGSFKPEYMQRNSQYLDLITTAYALWTEDYDTPERDSVIDEAVSELYRYVHRDKLSAPHIKITHTTNCYMPYEFFYDGVFIVDEKYMLGHYLVKYTDGTEAKLPVKYGSNIAGEKITKVLDGMSCGTIYHFSPEYCEVAGGTVPREIDGKFYFDTVYANPYPDKQINKIEFVKTMDGDFTVETKEIKY